MKGRLRAYRRRAVVAFIVLGVVLGSGIGLALGSFDGAVGRPSLNGAVVGFWAGVVVGITEEYVIPRLARSWGFRRLNAFRLTVFAVGLTGAVFVGNAIPRVVLEGLGPRAALENFVTLGHPVRDIGIALAASLVMTFLLQMRRLHNREELWRLFTGRFHSPRVERRVFLFVDLADSTGAAESLGPTRYSAFLRDAFRDMAEPILAHGGLVYQHAGDAVIVSWPFARALRDGACVHCFFDIADQLAREGDRYERLYDRRPVVRGAIHGGSVVTTWVGEAKRELAFHGDTVNTVARLQGLASSLDRPLLVSEALRSHLSLPGFRSDRLGGFDLRGRRTPLEVFAVSPLAGGALASAPEPFDHRRPAPNTADPPAPS